LPRNPLTGARVLILAYFESISTVRVTHTLRSLELVGSAAYALSGGLDELAQTVLPLSRNGTINGRADFAVTRSDTFTSNASVGVTTFSNGAKTAVESAFVGWRRQLTRATQGDVSAGVNVSQSIYPASQDTVVGAGPSASLGVSHQLSVKHPHQLLGSARVTYSAAIDPYGLGAYQRIEGTLAADYSAMGWLAFGLRATGAKGLSPSNLRNGLWQLEFTSRFAVEQHLAISGGLRGAWISPSQAALGDAAFPVQSFQWAAFVSLTVQQHGKL